MACPRRLVDCHAARVAPRRGAAASGADRSGRAALAGTGATFTAAAPHDGPIELCSLFPGELRGVQQRVEYDRTLPRALFRGGFDVVVAVWPSGTDVGARLAEAAEQDPTGLCRRELDRIGAPIAPPSGWEPHRQVPLAGLHREHDGELTSTAVGGWRSSAGNASATHGHAQAALALADGPASGEARRGPS